MSKKKKKQRVLFLDDRGKRIMSAVDKWYKYCDLFIVTTAKEAIKQISLKEWDYISLDYDLNFDEFTPPYLPGNGMEVVRYICEHAEFFKTERLLPRIIIHSANPATASLMVERLREAGFEAIYERWQYD